MQRGNKKFVRLYSEQYKLMANAIEGRCEMNTDYGFYQCGALGGCNPYCQDDGKLRDPNHPKWKNNPVGTDLQPLWTTVSDQYSSHVNNRLAGHYVDVS